jgi:DNA repair protein RecO (recombination protein O)
LEWTDEGIVLSVRQHGETGAVAEILTRGHGRYLGFVHGGQSRKIRPVLQTGNRVSATWRARIADQLGHFQLELSRGFAAEALTDPMALAGLGALAEFSRFLPERDPHPNLYEIMQFVLGYLDDQAVWPALYVRWELALLEELGVGLDLSACAATGATDDLIYVSPKSGRAVSRQAGEPYRDRLFRLPPFLARGDNRETELDDVAAALDMTAHFLSRRVLDDEQRELPEPRVRLARLINRAAART